MNSTKHNWKKIKGNNYICAEHTSTSLSLFLKWQQYKNNLHGAHTLQGTVLRWSRDVLRCIGRLCRLFENTTSFFENRYEHLRIGYLWDPDTLFRSWAQETQVEEQEGRQEREVTKTRFSQPQSLGGYKPEPVRKLGLSFTSSWQPLRATLWCWLSSILRLFCIERNLAQPQGAMACETCAGTSVVPGMKVLSEITSKNLRGFPERNKALCGSEFHISVIHENENNRAIICL